MNSRGIDWSTLGESQKGLAVEGKDDKAIIEAFLNTGEKQGLWQNWRLRIEVKVAGKLDQVLSEMQLDNSRVWGLIDRDWRTDNELTSWQNQYPRLRVLPRIMIENYCIDPQEVEQMLPPKKRLPNLRADIEAERDLWVQNGALWQSLHQSGAFEFCRGHEQGYPMALLHMPVTEETKIQTQFDAWHAHLQPKDVLLHYQQMVETFRANGIHHYTRHIHGKNFFKQVVVKVLNRHLGQKSEAWWMETLFGSDEITCPQDIAPVLQHVIG